MNYRKTFLCLLLFLGFAFCSAQDVNKLTGTWYAKPERRLEHATANIYTRHSGNSPKKLVIDNQLRYTYTRQVFNRVAITEGQAILKGDTIRFIPDAKYGGIKEDYYLYRLNNNELIYSSSLIHTQLKERDNSIFQPVEVSASYSRGDQALMAVLYKGLERVSIRDTVQLNTYRIVVDTTGKADISTLKEVYAYPSCFAAIKKVLQHLPAPFTPAQQNGDPVKAWMEFSITY